MANAKQLPGSHLLAALHAGMERMKTCAKVCKAASKKPQNRSNIDINYIVAETQGVQLLTQHGPGVHRDLCHVVQHCSLSQMASFRLPGEHPHGLFIYVMQGRIQVRTRAQFKPALSADDSSSSSNSGSGSKSGAGQRSGAGSTGGAAESSSSSSTDASEADLRALFNSIDVDGSGAIDVEELQYALEVMGIQKSAAEVQELMDSVDKDGSGELEFEEFQIILTTKLGVGRQQQSTWQELPDGGWALEAGQGSCLGAAAVTQGLAQEGLVLALEDSDLLLLGANTYTSILSTGFDGQLTAKMNILRACPALNRCLSNRSDLRGLAYVAVAETYSWGSRVLAAGQQCQQKGALYIIQEGAARIVGRVKGPSSSMPTAVAAAAQLAAAAAAVEAEGASSSSGGGAATAPGSAAAAAAALLASPRHGLHSPRARVSEQHVELAVVGPGDILGEAAVLGLSHHTSSAAVASAHLSVLKLQVSDLQQLMHAADLQALQEDLRKREAERSQRLALAAATTSALLVQQQHVRGVAAASAAAAAAAAGGDMVESSSGSSLLLQQQQRQRSPRQRGAADTADRDTERAAESVCVRGSSSSSRGLGVSVSGEGAMRLLLPSSGAAAAAAIAAAGGSMQPLGLPSRVARAEADAVSQLLAGLVGAKEDMQAAQAAVLEATAAALAAAGHSSSTCDGSALGSSSNTGSGQGPGPPSAVRLKSGPTASGRDILTSAPGGIGPSSSLGGPDPAAAAAVAAAAVAAAHAQSAPGAAAGVSGLRRQQQQQQGGLAQQLQQLQQQQPTLAHTLWPDRLLAKLHDAVDSCRHDPQQQQQKHKHSGRRRQQQQQGLLPCSTDTGAAEAARPHCAQHSSSKHRSRTDPGSVRRHSAAAAAPHVARPAAAVAAATATGAAAVTAASATGAAAASSRSSYQSSPDRLPSPPLSPRGVKKGLAVAAACPSTHPDEFFLQTGDVCCGAAMQGQRGGGHVQSGGGAVTQQQQQQQRKQQRKHGQSMPGHKPAGAARAVTAGAAATVGMQGSSSFSSGGLEPQLPQLEPHELPSSPGVFLTAAPMPSLAVLAPDAAAAAAQQLASGTINLPTPRSSRRSRSPCKSTPGSVTAAAATAATLPVAIVSVALAPGAAAAAAGAASTAGVHCGGPSYEGAWPRVSPRQLTAPGRLRACTASSSEGATATWGSGIGASVGAGSVLSCRGSIGGSSSSWLGVGSTAGGNALQGVGGTAVYCGSSCSSSPQGTTLLRVCGAHKVSSSGSSSSSGSGGSAGGRVLQPAAAEGAAAAAAAAAAGEGPSTARHSAGAQQAVGLQGLTGLQVQCSPARPVPGGLFVELDGPVWQAAECAADAASWCLSSRASRQQQAVPAGPMLQPEQQHQQQQSQQQQQVLGVAQSCRNSFDAAHSSRLPGPVTATGASGVAGVVHSTQALLGQNKAALLAAAQDLLAHPLPPGSLSSSCCPALRGVTPTVVASGTVPIVLDGSSGMQPDQGVLQQQLVAHATGPHTLHTAGPQQQQQQHRLSLPQDAASASAATAAAVAAAAAGAAAGSRPVARSQGGSEPPRGGQQHCSSRRPSSVPKLQLAQLQLHLPVAAPDFCCAASSAAAASCSSAGNSRWSGGGGAVTGAPTGLVAASARVASPRAAKLAAGGGCGAQEGPQSSQQTHAGGQQALNPSFQQPAAMPLPPALPAFTPRRVWAPGGPRSSR